MSASPMDGVLTAWKRQIDTGLRIAEAFVEGTEKAREIQLTAGVEAHAWLEANRQALQGALGPAELVALQSRLATENLVKMGQYWNRLAANARETQERIFRILAEAAPLPEGAAPQAALNAIVDAGYQRWIETLKRIYSLPHASAA